MVDTQMRRMMRRTLADRLREFHTILLTRFAAGVEDFLTCVERSLMDCPACGDEMVLSNSTVSIDPRNSDYFFACAKCGVSCFPEKPVASGYARM
ncbi:MAG TPA: hypothetical protein VGG11_06160 [Xanthobacteraceae bacterium]|jgi:predicted RNA-binding Zn-ribbon protein involved in translation (DUF1610 family)